MMSKSCLVLHIGLSMILTHEKLRDQINHIALLLHLAGIPPFEKFIIFGRGLILVETGLFQAQLLFFRFPACCHNCMGIIFHSNLLL